jgi:hypothetical protein
MARLIPVEGTIGPEESLMTIVQRYVTSVPRPTRFSYLENNMVIISFLDRTDINQKATELVGDSEITIYGPAIIHSKQECQ